MLSVQAQFLQLNKKSYMYAIEIGVLLLWAYGLFKAIQTEGRGNFQCEDARKALHGKKYDLDSDALHVLQTVSRQRRITSSSGFLGASLLLIPFVLEFDAISFFLFAYVIISSLQNFRAFHVEDQFSLLFNVASDTRR
jgi:hypothetical protein